MRVPFSLFILVAVLTAVDSAFAQYRAHRIAVIGFGESETARRVAQKIELLFMDTDRRLEFLVVDSDQTKAAANGAGYDGSLNLTLADARNVGAAIGSDFYFTGIAQTLRRSPSDAPIYFESYASVFLVSARTGKLVFWERQEFRRPCLSRLIPTSVVRTLRGPLLDHLSCRA